MLATTDQVDEVKSEVQAGLRPGLYQRQRVQDLLEDAWRRRLRRPHLPAELDRFLFNVLLDYLDDDEELAVVNRFTTRVDIPEVKACTNAEEIVRFQWLVRQIPVSEEVNRFAVNLVRATRPSEANAPDVVKRYVNYGASVRATMFVNLAAKASALLNGRYHVTEEDVRSLALPVLRHRVLCNYFAESDGMSVDDVLKEMLATAGS